MDISKMSPDKIVNFEPWPQQVNFKVTQDSFRIYVSHLTLQYAFCAKMNCEAIATFTEDEYENLELEFSLFHNSSFRELIDILSVSRLYYKV